LRWNGECLGDCATTFWEGESSFSEHFSGGDWGHGGGSFQKTIKCRDRGDKLTFGGDGECGDFVDGEFTC